METAATPGHDGRVKRLLALALIAAPRVAWPCAPAPPEGAEVAIVDEQAVIVWDPATKTEHFVRRARFATEAEAFGFLVPTPSVPELEAVDDAVFDRLEAAIGPETVVRTGLNVVPFALLATPFMMFKGAAVEQSIARGGVEVLKTQRVGGYDAVVLAADDPSALADWLTENGFAKSAELEAWLAEYVAKKWKLAAFKLAKAAPGEDALATSAVRMSFSTDEPFYPYREPASQREGDRPRGLRVFFVAPEPMRGMLAGKAWPGRVEYRAPKALESVAGVVVPAGAWLHAWTDDSAPRPGVDDVFFAPDRGADVVKPPPDIVDDRTVVPIPIDLIVVVIGVVWWWRRRRAR